MLNGLGGEVNEFDKKYEFTLTIKTKDGNKTELKLFSDWKYESEDILNFVMNKELQSIEYKKNGKSILITISEVKFYLMLKKGVSRMSRLERRERIRKIFRYKKIKETEKINKYGGVLNE